LDDRGCQWPPPLKGVFHKITLSPPVPGVHSERALPGFRTTGDRRRGSAWRPEYRGCADGERGSRRRSGRSSHGQDRWREGGTGPSDARRIGRRKSGLGRVGPGTGGEDRQADHRRGRPGDSSPCRWVRQRRAVVHLRPSAFWPVPATPARPARRQRPGPGPTGASGERRAHLPQGAHVRLEHERNGDPTARLRSGVAHLASALDAAVWCPLVSPEPSVSCHRS
jgi:hypothetical protein